jgi:hypothetical protein
MGGITEVNIRNIHLLLSNPRATSYKPFIYMNTKQLLPKVAYESRMVWAFF